MTEPSILDLYCGAGGMAEGLRRAGFRRIVGIDNRPQPNYPFEFHQGDALEVLRDPAIIGSFDAIHASPPCQSYIRSGTVARDGRHPDLLGPTRDLLIATGLPWTIENVPGAPMRTDVMLCGSMFGLEVRRHRWFESNVPLPPWTPPCDHSRRITGVYGNPHGARGASPAGTMLPSDRETWSRAMGIDWMTPAELSAAIPPAYGKWIGERLIEFVGTRPACAEARNDCSPAGIVCAGEAPI